MQCEGQVTELRALYDRDDNDVSSWLALQCVSSVISFSCSDEACRFTWLQQTQQTCLYTAIFLLSAGNMAVVTHSITSVSVWAVTSERLDLQTSFL